MESLTNLIKTVEPNLLNNHTSEKPRYENASESEIERYLERLYLIVADSFNLSSQMPTDNEKAARTEAWARALMGEIPEDELQSAFDWAFKNHTSNFPISAYDLKTAYQEIVENDKAVVEAERKRFMRDLEERDKITKRFECRSCFNSFCR